jgi:hypothetical protein
MSMILSPKDLKEPTLFLHIALLVKDVIVPHVVN